MAKNPREMGPNELLAKYPFFDPEAIKKLFESGLKIQVVPLDEIKRLSNNQQSGGFFTASDNTLYIPPNADPGIVAHEVFHGANYNVPDLIAPEQQAAVQEARNAIRLTQNPNLGDWARTAFAVVSPTYRNNLQFEARQGLNQAERMAFQVAGSGTSLSTTENQYRNQLAGKLFVGGVAPVFDTPNPVRPALAKAEKAQFATKQYKAPIQKKPRVSQTKARDMAGVRDVRPKKVTSFPKLKAPIVQTYKHGGVQE